MNDQVPTPKTTRSGTSKTSTEKQTSQKTNELDQLHETLTTFQSKVDRAKIGDEEYVETSPEVFDYFTKGTNPRYFTYQGIKIYKTGTKDACDEFDNLSVDDRAAIIMREEAEQDAARKRIKK